MVIVDRTPPGEHGNDGRRQCFGQFPQQRRRAGRNRAAAGDDERQFCFEQQSGRSIDALKVPPWPRRRTGREVATEFDPLLQEVAGQIQIHRSWFAISRNRERFVQGVGDQVSAIDPIGPFEIGRNNWSVSTSWLTPR